MARPEWILDVNRRYHDAVAREYDAKWGIGFGEVGRDQVVGKLGKLLGTPPGPYGRALEIGAGTGYFSLNLMTAGVIGEAVCTDVSPGMLAALERNAAQLGLEVGTVACDAGALPFGDCSFDLVVGHAVLHHLPDLERPFREFARVLRPAGTLFFAGEPSLYGDRVSILPKRVAWRIAPLWRRAVGARRARAAGNGAAPQAAGEEDGHELEPEVDVHAFTPGALASAARTAGLEQVRVRGEELLASWFGWFNRTLEASAEHSDIPWPWIRYAYNGYLSLQRVDRALLEPRLPPAIFYNLMIAARKPPLTQR
jgi:SAM-dependent methyltransferase